MTVDEAARLLGITPSRVRQLIASGVIVAKKEKGKWAWAIDRASLAKLGKRPAGRPRKAAQT